MILLHPPCLVSKPNASANSLLPPFLPDCVSVVRVCVCHRAFRMALGASKDSMSNMPGAEYGERFLNFLDETVSCVPSLWRYF
jgi:hypothetical protein